MAIKIDWQDLQKRYLGWDEVVKVMLNGGEIRPNTVPPTPPQPDYHIMWDFATSWASWQLPSGWSASTSWWATYTLDSNWINWISPQWVFVTWYMDINSLPDLSRASRVIVEVWFTSNGSVMEASFYPWRMWTSIITWTNKYLTTILAGSQIHEPISISNPYTWILKTTYGLCDENITQDLWNIHYSYDLDNESIDRLRNNNSFQIYTELWNAMTLTISNVDVYIWNASFIFNREYSSTSWNVWDSIKLYIKRFASGDMYWEDTSNLRFVTSWTDSKWWYLQFELISAWEWYVKIFPPSWWWYDYDKIYITINP